MKSAFTKFVARPNVKTKTANIVVIFISFSFGKIVIPIVFECRALHKERPTIPIPVLAFERKHGDEAATRLYGKLAY